MNGKATGLSALAVRLVAGSVKLRCACGFTLVQELRDPIAERCPRVGGDGRDQRRNRRTPAGFSGVRRLPPAAPDSAHRDGRRCVAWPPIDAVAKKDASRAGRRATVYRLSAPTSLGGAES
jgi:hypothetical protein